MPSGAMNSTVAVQLPTGTVEVPVVIEAPEAPWASLVLAHGAGAGMEHPFLLGFAAGMRAEGVRTVRFTFPYRVLGRRMPGPAAHAIATWQAVVAATCQAAPAWLAGKSYGGRMASMAVAGGLPAAGLAYLGYPLHAPGKPEKPRLEQLPTIAAPQLFLSGTRDPFVDPHEQLEAAVAACQQAQVQWIQDGSHSFEVAGRKRPADDIGADLAPRVADFMRARTAAP